MNEKILKLLEDRKFCEDLVNFENEIQVKEYFKDHGVEISDEDLKCVGDLLNELEDKIKDLSPEQLEIISGGGPKEEAAEKAAERAHTIALVDRGVSFFKDGMTTVLNFLSGRHAQDSNAQVETIKTQEENITKREAQKFNFMAGAAAVSTIALLIYVGNDLAGKWFKKMRG